MVPKKTCRREDALELLRAELAAATARAAEQGAEIADLRRANRDLTAPSLALLLFAGRDQSKNSLYRCAIMLQF